jgi:fumarate hydratase class I
VARGWCSPQADRQALGKITEEGIFLEQLETNPGRFLPEVTEDSLGEPEADVVKVDLNMPMDRIREKLSQYVVPPFLVWV